MAGFTENLKVEIESIFNSAGFDKLQAELAQTKTMMADTFGQAKQMRQMRREAEKFAGVLDRADLGQVVGGEVPFFDKDTGGPVEAAEGTERMADAMDSASVVSAAFSENVQSGNQALKEAQKVAQNTRIPAIQDTRRISDVVPRSTERTMDQFNRTGPVAGRDIQTPRVRSLFSGAGSGIGFLNINLARLSELSSITRIKLTKLAGTAMGLAGSMKAAGISTRALQMRLLGLQFTMLTVAFIFGGLLASALGAVGVFKVLGNTLKFLFLPTALNVLGGVLGIQEAVMGMDEETRQLIGDIFLWISVFAIIIGLAAALGKALVSAAVFIKILGAILLKVGGFLKTVLFLILKFASWVGGTLVKALSAAGSMLGAVLSFLGGLVAGFLIVTETAKRFGKKIALVVGAVLIAIGAIVAAVASIPAVIIAAIGLIIGAILGLIWTFKDTIIGAIQGVVNAIVGLFEWLFNVLVGNSIVPEMVKSIINFILSIPRKIIGLGASIVDVIVQGIKSAGTAIWDAFKKILPDFLVNAIEGAGKAVKGLVKSGGQVVGAAGDVIGSVGQGIADTAAGIGESVGGLFSGGGDKPKQEKNVQQNNINAEVQVNDKEETPQETGRQFGRGAADGLNQRSNNNASGF